MIRKVQRKTPIYTTVDVAGTLVFTNGEIAYYWDSTDYKQAYYGPDSLAFAIAAIEAELVKA